MSCCIIGADALVGEDGDVAEAGWRASDNKATIAQWCASGASANAALVHPGPAIFSALPSQLMSTPCHMLLSSAEIFL